MICPDRRRRFLRDITCAMRLAEAPHGLGEFYCQAPAWEQDRAKAALWYDEIFVEAFSVEDFPELPDPIQSSLSALVASFRGAVQDVDVDRNNSLVLANTHLWSIIDRLWPALEQYWASCAAASHTLERSHER